MPFGAQFFSAPLRFADFCGLRCFADSAETVFPGNDQMK
jgi:hypothetical protein